MSRKAKKNSDDRLARVVGLGFRGLEKKLVEVYRGMAGLLEALRGEMNDRFDRLERFVLPRYKRRMEMTEQKRR